MDIENIVRLGVFDLNLAVLPGEKIPLHIFEPRYKQLISDCKSNAVPFCIPVRGKKGEDVLACVIKLKSVDEVLKEGRMNVTVEGAGLARAVSPVENPALLYDEIQAELLEVYESRQATAGLRIRFDNYCSSLEVADLFPSDAPLSIYEIANSIGLSNRQKKRFLRARNFGDVQENILLNHLNMSRAVMKQEDDVIDGLILN